MIFPSLPTTGIVAQASTLVNGDGKPRGGAEGSTEARVLISAGGQVHEVGPGLSLSPGQAAEEAPEETSNIVLPVSPGQGAEEADEDGPLGGGGASPPNYLDSLANSPENGKRFNNNQSACPGWFTLGLCENGHAWAKELICGREWCPDCRDKARERRVARWMTKARQVKSMGYLVVTFAPEDRLAMRTKADLAEVGKIAAEVVRQFAPRGLRRWHFFGDKSSTPTYHPHLNFLLDAGWIDKPLLNLLRLLLKEALGLAREPVVNYHYSDKPKKMRHWLRYVCRATFLDRAWDLELAEELWNFRNVAWWGKWDGLPAWDVPETGHLVEVERLEKGLCPTCGLAIEWTRPRPIAWLSVWDAKPLEGGYYALGP